jgi:quinol-cytochrome oxidoreductase complex cytochrome b subunit
MTNGDKESQDNPIPQWGGLVFIIILMILSIYISLTTKSDDWTNTALRIAVPIILLISHLKGYFNWSQRGHKFLNILSLS